MYGSESRYSERYIDSKFLMLYNSNKSIQKGFLLDGRSDKLFSPFSADVHFGTHFIHVVFRLFQETVHQSVSYIMQSQSILHFDRSVNEFES